MRRLSRFLSLPDSERRLLITAAFILGGVRLALRLLPFRAVVRVLDRAGRPSRGVPMSTSIARSRLAWAVRVVSPYVLGVRPCLPQALTVQLLLRRRGYPARLHFGVARGEGGQVQAHAWVESDGRVVIGGSASELERYTPLLALDAQTA